MEIVPVPHDTLRGLCERATAAAGADGRTARALANATVSAELRGRKEVGVTHLFDYLAALRAGRINPSPRPVVRSVLPAVIAVDADDGVAQVAFAQAAAALRGAAGLAGIAFLSVSDSYTVGELGHYVASVAEHGLLALAGANSPALVSAFESSVSVTGTNPMAFAVPGEPRPRVVDQASSVTAWVQVRDAANRGESIPPGWAVDADGKGTTDAVAALAGSLLPFGGVKGGNIAFLIDLLCGLGGARFSIDAPSFRDGARPPKVGMWVIAISPSAVDPDYLRRVDAHFARLEPLIQHDYGRRRSVEEHVRLPRRLLEQLRVAAGE